jgi:YidC/Oxa1 family membrane protein insertase
MDRYRFLLALGLSLLVLVGWPVIMRYLSPPPPPPPPNTEIVETLPPSDLPLETPKPVVSQNASSQTTNTKLRVIEIDTLYWTAKFSNRGAFATSWIIKKSKTAAIERQINAADGGPLELIPQNVLEKLGGPFSVRLPWNPELETKLNAVNFEITGVGANEDKILLGSDEQRQITFTYSGDGIQARKTFTFRGDQFLVDITADVTTPSGGQLVEIQLGPRIGDQSDKRTNGTYTTPPQIIAYSRTGNREAVLGKNITPPFAKITAIDFEGKRIQIDKPAPQSISEIKLVSGDDHILVGYARIVSRENDQLFTVNALPELAAVGNDVSQAFDTLRHGYLWAGVVDHYFGMVAVSKSPVDVINLRNVNLKESGSDAAYEYPSAAIAVSPDSATQIFVGPKDRELLAEIGQEQRVDLEALIDYGFFSFMVRPLIPIIGWALDGFASVLHNYGWSIVAVTVVINLFLSPLRLYSSRKMKKAAKHQPRLKELQERMKKLKENPKKTEREMLELQKEQMALMKEANPLGGCLPLLLQMPIFWAFFIYLTISLDVRHAPWIMWVKDLSTPDPYHILPIVMCVTMIASTKLTPQPMSDDPAMKMQRIMMTWLMPIMLTWLFFFSAPSGLVLYWMVSNVMGVLIQLVINKVTAEPVEPVAPGRNGGSPTKGSKDKAGSKSGKKSSAKERATEKEVVGSVK